MLTRATVWWSDVVKHRMIALVMAVIVLVPLVTTPISGAVHNLDALAVQILSIVVLAVLLGSDRLSVNKEGVKAFIRAGVNLPVLLFIGFGVISWCWASNRVYSAQETMRIISGIILYFAVAYQFRRSEHLSKLVDALLFLSIAVSLYGFAQFAHTATKEAMGPFGDHQLYGSFLMILLPLIGTVAVTEQNKNRQLVAQCGTVMVAANLLIAHSRSAWIGAAVGLACLSMLAVASMWKNRAQNLAARKHEFIVPVLLIVASVGFFMLISPQGAGIVDRMNTLQSIQSEKGWIYRESMLEGAVAMFRAHPLGGVGIGQFPVEQHSYTHMGAPLGSLNVHPALSEQAHNYYAQTAAELGVPGILLFLSILIVFFVTGTRQMLGMEAGIRRNLLMGSLAAVASFAVDAYASPAWQLGQVSMFFWLAMGIGVACQLPKQRAARSESRARVDLPAKAVALRPMWARPVAVATVLLLAGLLTSVNASPVPGYSKPRLARLTANPNPMRVGTNSLLKLEVQFEDAGGNVTSYIDVSENGPLVGGNPDWTTTYAVTGTVPAGLQTGLSNRQGPVFYSTNRVFTCPAPGTASLIGTYTSGVETISATADVVIVR